MIKSNRSHFGGLSHFGVVETTAFSCALITAPEGIGEPSSTVFMEFSGDWETDRDRRIVAKAHLQARLSAAQQSQVHAALLDQVNQSVGVGFPLDSAIRHAVAKEAQSVARFIALPPGDPFSRAEQYTAESRRLVDVVGLVAASIGEAPIGYNSDGQVFVHPALSEEFAKPGNELLADILEDTVHQGTRRMSANG